MCYYYVYYFTIIILLSICIIIYLLWYHAYTILIRTYAYIQVQSTVATVIMWSPTSLLLQVCMCISDSYYTVIIIFTWPPYIHEFLYTNIIYINITILYTSTYYTLCIIHFKYYLVFIYTVNTLYTHILIFLLYYTITYTYRHHTFVNN